MYIGTGSVVHSMSPGTGVYHRVGQTDKGIEGIPVQMSQGIGVYHRVGQTD